MASKDKYTRGSSGYSVADEKEAERSSKIERRISSDALRRKEAGEKGIVMTADEVESRAKRNKENYLKNTRTPEGRETNKKNLDFSMKEDLPKANSRAQYEHEKQVGDPSATRLSFEEWKKL